MRLVADRHLPLLHHLEQCRLHLGRGPVDLVRQEEVAEDRTELGVEGALAGPKDACADQVGGNEVRCELDARERPAEHRRRRLDGQRLRQAGYAFDQQVPLGEQTDEDPLEHGVLAGDHPPDLEQRRLETFPRLGCGGSRTFVGGRAHEVPP
jgi:hypothetical protein